MASFEITVGSRGYVETFTNDGGNVEIEISQCTDPRGRYGWRYVLTWNDEIVFEGDDLSTPHCDTLRALEDLAGFLTTPYRDWDEDADPYTELQRSWLASSECESLSWEIETLEDEDSNNEDEDEDEDSNNEDSNNEDSNNEDSNNEDGGIN